MKNVIIGIDLGGTNLRIGAVNKENQMVNPSVFKSAPIAEASDPVQTLCQFIEEYRVTNGIKELDAISIGVPSSVANDKETVICTTNIRNADGEVVFQNKNIAADIRACFHVPVYVNNDVNNILQYDIAVNGLENQKIVAGIYIGTGLGASVVIDGKPMEGKDGAELDLGHIPFFNGTASCSCGKKGCCECYASGWRLQQIRMQYFPDTQIQDMFTLHKEEGPVREFIDACAYIYAVMATIFNPDSLVVGGGVMEMKDFPRDEFEKAVNERVGADVMKYGFQYVYSEEYVGKGVIGAAVFARNRIEKKA